MEKRLIHRSDNTGKPRLKFSHEYMTFFNYLTFMDWTPLLRPKLKQNKTKKMYLIQICTYINIAA